jgi:hypothetical protein
MIWDLVRWVIKIKRRSIHRILTLWQLREWYLLIIIQEHQFVRLLGAFYSRESMEVMPTFEEMMNGESGEKFGTTPRLR